MKVSIIVPIYNQEKYLNSSIFSLLNQTYNDIEVVLVNDGSTDKSADIIKKFEERDSRIFVVTKENGGLVDATITGIKHSTGDYICFVDPDDFVDTDFISNFVEELEDGIDVLSMGYYLDDNGTFTPKYLSETTVYSDENLNALKDSFLYEPGEVAVSNKLFISRWNKIYTSKIVKSILPDFEKCQNITLGEDSIFTALILSKANNIKTIKYPNSYFYNIGNQTSMMKSTDFEKGIEKSKNAYEMIKLVSKVSENQAIGLYFFLVENLFQRFRKYSNSHFLKLYKYLKNDELYQRALNLLKSGTSSKVKRLELASRENLSAESYLFLNSFILKGKELIKFFLQEIPTRFSDLKKFGFHKATKQAEFRNLRKKAFIDLYEELPRLEKEITPLLDKLIEQKPDLKDSSIERNIFIFWWDGFENAPKIVLQCLKSVRKFNPEANIVEISKKNFFEYTDIHPEILKGFEQGNISIQTFSDILRFNLLKINGGVWVDSTILFLKEFDMFSELEGKSFTSVSFTSSSKFLKYKDEVCSWSGFFIASRKNGYFVSVMDSLFEQYYLKYQKYPFYFFIDALLMICKLNKVDDSVLDKTIHVNADMFLLSKSLHEEYNEYSITQLKKIPQKLSWFYKNTSSNSNSNSFFNRLEL